MTLRGTDNSRRPSERVVVKLVIDPGERWIAGVAIDGREGPHCARALDPSRPYSWD